MPSVPAPGPAEPSGSPDPQVSAKAGSGTAAGDDGAASSTAGSGHGSGGIERLKVIGGLVALSAGLITLIVIVVVALIVEPDTTGGSIATAAIGVIGSIVGAYFGVKVGSDGTQSAVTAQKQEAAKAQVFALHTPPESAGLALQQIEQLIGLQAPPPKGK